MTNYLVPGISREILLENFAAELTSAAYALVLRHGIDGSWITVELGFWKATAQIVRKWAQEWPLGKPWDEIKAWREGFLGDLTEGAFYVAVKHGIKGVPVEIEHRLNQAFRSVIKRISHEAWRHQIITHVRY